MILRSRAPVRVDFAGGGTDLSPFAEEVGGAVVNATINRYTYCTLHRRDDDSEAVKIISQDFDTSVEVTHWRELEYDGHLDLIKAAIKRLKIDFGMDILTRCDAPPGSGLGTSASVGVALIGLLSYTKEDKLTKPEVAELAQKLEIEELDIVVGKQDQYAASIGGFNYMEFEDVVIPHQLKIKDEVLYDLEKHLVLCYTGKSRLSGDIVSNLQSYKERTEISESLYKLKELAGDMREALTEGKSDRIGEILLENWECQKMWDTSVTNDYIDYLFKAALKNGALGGKGCGAGGGGCLLFYCDSDREDDVRKVLESAGARIIDFNFDFRGLQIWSAS